MGSETYITALNAADELDGTPIVTVEVTIAKKPLIDWELAELGKAIATAHAVKKQADHTLRLLEVEQTRRITELRTAEGRLSEHKHDAGHSWFITNPAPQPNVMQTKVLAVFQLALVRGDHALLTDAYNLCLLLDAQITNWRADTGEALEVAYERRMKELAIETENTDADADTAEAESA